MDVRIVATRIPPPAWLLLSATAMAVLHHWLPLVSLVPPSWSPLGWVVVTFGLAIDVSAFLLFRRVGTTVNPLDPTRSSRLVTRGWYRISRNPMYLGQLLMLAGWALWLGSLSPLLIPPLFAWVIDRFQIRREEQALARTFGDEFATYCRHVNRWLGVRRPRIDP